MASLIVSNTLNLELMEWKCLLKSLGTGGPVKVTYVHYPFISRVEARVFKDSITCILNVLGQFLQECLILPIAQEAVCVYVVVPAIEAKLQRVVWGLNSFITWGHKSDLCRGSPKVQSSIGLFLFFM